eukprot:340894-Rhodomonas_salina.4
MVLAGHSLQSSIPTSSAYPWRHGVHDPKPSPATDPTPHSSHAPVSLFANEPAGHARHSRVLWLKIDPVPHCQSAGAVHPSEPSDQSGPDASCDTNPSSISSSATFCLSRVVVSPSVLAAQLTTWNNLSSATGSPVAASKEIVPDTPSK